MAEDAKPSEEGPIAWVISLALAILGLLTGAISVAVLYFLIDCLVQFSPLHKPWPPSYYAKADYAELCVITLVDAGLFVVLRRQSKVFALFFAAAAVCLILFLVFLTAIGLDGSWYIP